MDHNIDKKCIKCKETKELSLFGFRKDSGKYTNKCKECCLIYAKEYRKNNKIKISKKDKDRYNKNKSKVLKKAKIYRDSNKNKISKNMKIYYVENRDKILKNKHEYHQKNKDKIREKKREYRRIKRKTDPCFRLRGILRSRLYQALKGNYKAGSAIRDLGCSIEELKKYLESKFQPNMTWKNYGKWHIDHIKPLASFDLTDRKQFLIACAYNNLQPLWAKDNLSKGAKYGPQR